MALADYPTNESWERIYNALIGVNVEVALYLKPSATAWMIPQVIQVNVLKVGNLPK